MKCTFTVSCTEHTNKSTSNCLKVPLCPLRNHIYCKELKGFLSALSAEYVDSRNSLDIAGWCLRVMKNFSLKSYHEEEYLFLLNVTDSFWANSLSVVSAISLPMFAALKLLKQMSMCIQVWAGIINHKLLKRWSSSEFLQLNRTLNCFITADFSETWGWLGGVEMKEEA